MSYGSVAYLISVGGEGGIRTHGTVTRTTVFETVPFDLSGTSPWRSCNLPVHLRQPEDARKNRKKRERGQPQSRGPGN
jgi:hypothetical protein